MSPATLDAPAQKRICHRLIDCVRRGKRQVADESFNLNIVRPAPFSTIKPN